MNEDNVAIRLKGFIDSSGLTSSQFADNCGIPRPSLSQLLTGRNKKISDVLVGQIHAAYPQLSILWLLFGEGEMLVNSPESDESGEDGESKEGNPNGSKKEVYQVSSSGSENRLAPTKSEPKNGGTEIEMQLLLEKDREIEELRRELERMKKSPRRVAQITVYYDDSTFETFFPASANGKIR